ncbi:unnamed protein product [Trichogramma brassicae]|uniref:Reverse transcriptase domain-containing protein n=1 Tax=Trichogramma brassicae TaxID=86971 RepID=A0A6H5IWS0_9HYME|nr:unnamed protein product [Trichogramma brassicae]
MSSYFGESVQQREKSRVLSLTQGGRLLLSHDGQLGALQRSWPRQMRCAMDLDRPGVHGRTEMTRGMRRSSCSLLSMLSFTNWTVLTDATTSDHRTILITVEEDVLHAAEGRTRYNTKRTSWHIFVKKFVEIMKFTLLNSPTEPTEIDVLLEKITNAITVAAKRSMPTKKRFPESLNWWNEQLNGQKKEVYRTRRQCQNEPAGPRKEHLKQKLKQLIRRYRCNAYRARTNSWKKFVEDSSRENPFGFIYKMCAHRLSTRNFCTSIVTETRTTTTWQDSMTAIMDSLFGPSEKVESNHALPMPDPLDQNSATEWTDIEVIGAIRSMKSNKAPGLDMVEVEFLKHLAAGGAVGPLTMLYNACRRCGYFPETWKTANVRVLIKGPDKDPTHPKSYRPICLLSVLSKVLERLICWRLKETMERPQFTSNRQFGFRVGGGTEDAINKMRELVSESNHPVVLALLFDITGAFDNIQWTSIIGELRRRQCPGNMLRLVASYLSGRRVSISNGFQTITRKISKGCPQGSVLGPNFWNACMDSVLIDLELHDFQVVAYADDIIVLIEGSGRRQLEAKAQAATDLIVRWCTKEGLQLSQTKTEMIMLKTSGFYCRSIKRTGLGGVRPPTVKISGKSIKYAENATYLGVTFGTDLDILKHIESTSTKTERIFSSIASLARANWGLGFRTISILYRAVYVPIMLYAAGTWCDLIKSTHRKKLLQSQRKALITMTKAYTTTSTNALQVLAGALPLDLLAKQQFYRFKVRKHIEFSYEDIEYRVADRDTQPNIDRQTLEDIDTQIRSEWSEHWRRSNDAPITKLYFPDISDRMDKTWIEADHYTNQFLTGHGDFQSKLHYFKLQNDDRCHCGAEDTPTHELVICQAYEEERRQLISRLKDEDGNQANLTERSLVSSRANFLAFRDFCKSVSMKKTELRRRPS